MDPNRRCDSCGKVVVQKGVTIIAKGKAFCSPECYDEYRRSLYGSHA